MIGIGGVIGCVVTMALSLTAPKDLYCLQCNDWVLHCKDATIKTIQNVVDNPNIGAHFYYGEFNNDVFADHCNQAFKDLKYVNVGDTLRIYYRRQIKDYTCVAV